MLRSVEDDATIAEFGTFVQTHKVLVLLQDLEFFRLKCRFKGLLISRIHLSLANAYTLMCFDRNIKGKRDVKFLESDYLLVQRCVKLTLETCLVNISRFTANLTVHVE